MAKRKVKKITRTSAPFGVEVPEKRHVNFFVRVKKSNSDWVKEQAKAIGICYSEYMDLVIEKLKDPSRAEV